MSLQIIYEDENFLAVNKPSGLLVYQAKNSKQAPDETKKETLIDFLLKEYPEIKNVGDEPKIRPGIVHRLDKDTSGVILIARNQRYFNYLKNLFQKHQIKKIYLALVWGKLKLKRGIIERPIKIKKGTIKRTIWKGKGEKIAITEFRVLRYLRQKPTFDFLEPPQIFSLIEVSPKTGRTHQIRIHLASIGHPVVGDKLYGFKKRIIPFNLHRQFLHAQSVEFPIEEGRVIKIEAELPQELQEVLDNLTNSK